jgi:hypothetical protein
MLKTKISGFKGKVVANARKQISDARAERELRKKEAWAKRYNTPKVFEFPKKNINMERHFYFPKFVGHENFRKLTTAGLSVYPVLCSMADFKNNQWFQVSVKNIAQMAGVTLQMVSRGVEELIEGNYALNDKQEDETLTIPLLQRKKVTEGERHFYMYRTGFIRQDMIERWKGMYFVFYTSIIDSGIWAKLPARAKALYLVMRNHAKFDFILYCDIETNMEYFEMQDIQNGEEYRNRKWDVCKLSLSELCRMVNIERSNIKTVLDELKHYGLIEQVEDEGYMVYLQPNERFVY